ncbi:hypothetical protein Tco_1429985 [Tanacetum coccineum]
MIAYLKHIGGKKHSNLKTKTFEEIQVLYERLKRQDQNFVAIRSAKDERQIKELNKDPKKKRVIKETPRKEDTAKVPAQQEVTEQDDGSDDEHRKCLRIVTCGSTIDSEIIETKSFIARLHKVSSLDGNYLVVYRVNGHFRAFNYLMEVLHIFYRQDLFHLYDLVMKQYSEITPEDIELILWGDLKIMMESSTEENDQGDFWNNQQEWEIVRWRLYEACGVCILELKDGTVIYMLVERRYPLSKELLQRMLDLGLEVEEESTAALQLLKVKIYSVIRSNIKVSPWKGVVRFGERGKFSLCYIGPFKILARVGPVAYTLELPEELKGIHNTFHILNLKKRLVEGDVVVPMDEIQLDDKLHMIEEPMEVVDREVKRLKQSRIPIVRVR